MNKKGQIQVVIIVAILIILILLALGFFSPKAKTPYINLKDVSNHNLSYGSYQGAVITLDLVNPRSEAVNVNWVMEYDPNLLQVNQISRQVDFGMVIPQYLYAEESREIQIGVSQLQMNQNKYVNLTIYLCDTDRCLNRYDLSEYFDREVIPFHLG